MIILGGEPPFIENPAPEFGEVIIKLNQITLAMEKRAGGFNQNVEEKLTLLKGNINEFVLDVTTKVNAHLNAKGAVHDETKSTIGLSLKDNYRTATLMEQANLEDVDAFVTPAGARLAVETMSETTDPDVDIEFYQKNDVLALATFYIPDEFPIKVPTVAQPSRCFIRNKPAAVLLNRDRLIFQPKSDVTHYETQDLFFGLHTKLKGESRLAEVPNLATTYSQVGWNQIGCDTDDGKINFFRALADRKIYQFKTLLTLPAGIRNYILYENSINTWYKGLGVVGAYNEGTIKISHEFFHTLNGTVDPAVAKIVGDSYMALFDLMAGDVYPAPVNNGHELKLTDFVNLPEGATVQLTPNSQGIVTSLLWNVQDSELYLNVSVALTITLGLYTKPFVLSFTESVVPGSLAAGGTASFTLMGDRVKDTLSDRLVLNPENKWLKVSDPYDFHNITQSPGVVLNNGDVVKAFSSKYGMRVKRLSTQFKGFKDWLTSDRPNSSIKNAGITIFSPARHSPFGIIPERILPISQANGVTEYLVYSVSPINGKFVWTKRSWKSTDLVSVQTEDNRFGIKVPDSVTLSKKAALLPSSIMMFSNAMAPGIVLGGLAFTAQTNFIGRSSVAYEGDNVTVGTPIVMIGSQLAALRGMFPKLLVNAAANRPDINPSLRQPQLFVYGLTANKALIILTDGVSYAEAGTLSYTIVNNAINLGEVSTDTLILKTISHDEGTVRIKGTSRESKSGDGPMLDFCDLLVYNTTSTIYNIVLTRPFGRLYGDLSFRLANVTSSSPILRPLLTNPAHLYPGVDHFDLVDELHPPVMIPTKGIMQFDISKETDFNTPMKEVARGELRMDPYDINEPGWVTVPAGSRAVIGGRTFLIDQAHAVKVAPVGVNYCYLVKTGETLSTLVSSTQREIKNNEVLFGISTDGVITYSKGYLVIDGHVVSNSRKGSAIPAFKDNGGTGDNRFFTKRDVV